MEDQSRLEQELDEERQQEAPTPNAKVVVVMPAYNAAQTLEKTYRAIPPGSYDSIILVDDASKDNTMEVAEKLNLIAIRHPQNRGYGGNQKTCYTRALQEGAEIIVMLHPDYQYDPSMVPELVAPIASGEADVVLASRLLGDPLKGGMPIYKYIANRFLTILENIVLGTKFSEFHTGYRAFSREALESVSFMLNSDNFVFDNEILVQLVIRKKRFTEIRIPTRYSFDSSSVSFWSGCVYGMSIFKTIAKYLLHRAHIVRYEQFI